MIAGFKSVGWVAGVAVAALGCYMTSLKVAAERAELASIERRIVVTHQNIRALQTELGTRGRLSQLERWNADVLALSAPVSGQYLDSAMTLARFDVTQPTIADQAPVRMASAGIAPATSAQPAPQRTVAAIDYAAAAAASERAEPRATLPAVRRAALVVGEPAPPPAVPPRTTANDSKPALLDDRLLQEIGAAAKVERQASPAN
jgi:hypothetical protein